MNLNQVTEPSTDIRRSIDFYQRLGLVLIVEDLPSYARFECPEGDATFSLHQTSQPPGSPGVVVYFECEDLDSTVARLKGRGLRFESESQDQPWLWREAFLKDPDGNVICLVRAGENRKNPPWRLRRTSRSVAFVRLFSFSLTHASAARECGRLAPLRDRLAHGAD